MGLVLTQIYFCKTDKFSLEISDEDLSIGTVQNFTQRCSQGYLIVSVWLA
jgi:hypothetical protein